MADPFQMQNPTLLNMMQGAGPGASLPQMPVGAMAGGMQVQNQQRLEQFAEMQKQANLMSLAQQLMQQQEYQQNEGWRAAERAAGIEKANTTRDTFRRGQEAEIGAKELDLRKGRATEASDVAAKVAGNEAKLSEAQIVKMENFANELGAQSEGWDAMTAPVEFEKLADAHGVPKNHPIRQMAQRARSPQEFQVAVKGLQQRLVQNVQFQRQSALERQKSDASYRERIDAANIGANATMNAARLRANADRDIHFKNPANALARAEEVLTSLPADLDVSKLKPEERQVVEQMVQVYDRGLADKVAKVQQAVMQQRQMMLAVTNSPLSAAQEKVLKDQEQLLQKQITDGAPAFYKKVRGLDKPAAPKPAGERPPLSSFQK